jgi:hypothetical protein
MGIPPEHVREALMGRFLPRSSGSGDTTVALALGDGTLDVSKGIVRVDRIVDRALRADEIPAVVAEIHATLGMAGHASVIGRSLTWSPAGQGPEGRALLVTVDSTPSGTTIHVEERLPLTGLWQAAPGLSAAGGGIIGACWEAPRTWAADDTACPARCGGRRLPLRPRGHEHQGQLRAAPAGGPRRPARALCPGPAAGVPPVSGAAEPNLSSNQEHRPHRQGGAASGFR